MRLKDQRAIVTGGGSGFGAAIAKRLAAEGARVLVTDLRGETAERVAGEIGEQARAHRVDVTVLADLRAAVEAIEEQWGGLDIVVNNAGYTHLNRPLTDIEEDDYDRTFDANMKSIYLSARATVPALRKAGGGNIINICSALATRPRPGICWYAASKSAALTATRVMALELAGDGIRVNAINPTAADTPMLERFLPDGDRTAMRQKFVDTIPLGRFCQPEDVAGAVVYLASDDASFVTGAAMEIDGGRTV